MTGQWAHTRTLGYEVEQQCQSERKVSWREEGNSGEKSWRGI